MGHTYEEGREIMAAYPAIFIKEGGGYWVCFPDLDGCLTEGDSLTQHEFDDKIKQVPVKTGCHRLLEQDGLCGKKLQAGNAPTRFTRKLARLRHRLCSTWQIFFRKSFADSMTARFRGNSFSSISICLSFTPLLSRVVSFIPLRYSRSNSSHDIHSRSPKNFHHNSRRKWSIAAGFLPSILPRLR
jgi:hypothetical protein